MNLLPLPIKPVDPAYYELLKRHTRTIVAPEMQGCAGFKEAPPRKRAPKPNSVYGKGRERILTYLRTHSPSTTLLIIQSLSMHGDHTRHILRQLEADGLARCLDRGNRGERRAAIWTAIISSL